MFRVPPRKLKVGDELLLDWLNDLRAEVLRNTIQPGQGLTAQQTETGIAIGIGETGRRGFIGKTNGAITARVGTTYGTGSVFRVYNKGTAAVVSSEAIDVLNFSSTSGGIPTATYVFVQEDDSGNLFIASVDCG